MHAGLVQNDQPACQVPIAVPNGAFMPPNGYDGNAVIKNILDRIMTHRAILLDIQIDCDVGGQAPLDKLHAINANMGAVTDALASLLGEMVSQG